LRNAHGADFADGHVIEVTLAPDQIGEESDREIVGLRNRDKTRADLLLRQRRGIRVLERGPCALQRRLCFRVRELVGDIIVVGERGCRQAEVQGRVDRFVRSPRVRALRDALLARRREIVPCI